MDFADLFEDTTASMQADEAETAARNKPKPRRRSVSAGRRVRFDAATTSTSKRSRSRPQSKKARKTAGVSKRPKDLFIEDVAQRAELIAAPVEPAEAVFADDVANGTGDANVAIKDLVGNGHSGTTVDAYPVVQRYLVESMLTAGDFEKPDTEQSAQNVRAALVRAQQKRQGMAGAALTNHMIRLVNAERVFGPSITMRSATPYTTDTSAFSSNFISAAIERTPNANAHEHMPSNEMRAASKGVPRAYIERYQRSARGGEPACSERERCFGMSLYGKNDEELPKSVWCVFWFPHEEAELDENPEKYEKLAAYRLCIGCKVQKANELVINVAARNNRVDPTMLGTDFHIFADLPGEFPIEATIGPGSHGHNGLFMNVPRCSSVGWQVVADGQRSDCYQYHWALPKFPIEPEYYEANLSGTYGGYGPAHAGRSGF